MTPDISERAFEDAIECALLKHGPDACAGDAATAREAAPPYGDTLPGGYRKRRHEDYDRTLCLLPRDVVDFVLATQPKEWKKLEQHHGSAVREQFLKRLSAEIERRGALDVLRNGIKDSGCKFRLAYFRPASGLNEETRRLHAANLFSVVRQVHYSTKNENCLDLVLFLNGIPIFTAELKNPFNGQDVEDAIRPGQRVLALDDLLATGGTMGATLRLIRQLGGHIVGVAFMIELAFLHGREKLKEHPLHSLIVYE